MGSVRQNKPKPPANGGLLKNWCESGDFILAVFLTLVKGETEKEVRMIVSNIRTLCKARNMTIARLEKETGLSNGSIARWDEHSPSVERVKKVADYFGVSLDSIVQKRRRK